MLDEERHNKAPSRNVIGPVTRALNVKHIDMVIVKCTIDSIHLISSSK